MKSTGEIRGENDLAKQKIIENIIIMIGNTWGERQRRWERESEDRN
jgi:hypothetical protein